VKVIINPQNSVRKEYEHLPERGPNDLIRQRLEQRHLEEERNEAEQSATGEMETAMPVIDEDTWQAQSPIPDKHDLLANFLSDGDAEEEGGEASLLIEDEDEHSWKNSRWVPYLFLGALMALGGIWYFATHYASSLPLEQVRVEGASLLKDQEIISLAGIDRNERFYSIDLEQVKKNILRHSLIESAHPHREMNPATIVLDVVERQPIAMLRSETTGEAYIIDREGMLLRPKLLAGLRDPAKLMQLPLLSGVSEKDTMGYQAMARLVIMMQSLDSGALRTAIGELHRTPTGDYVAFSSETQTPIFIGSPFETEFRTALEMQRDGGVAKTATPLFDRQLDLLAKLWRSKLQNELRTGSVLYVDARFGGQIVLKHKTQNANVSLQATVKADSIQHKLITSVTSSPNAQGHR
jgi:hypothetical protein